MALMDAAGSAVSRQALAELFLPESPGGFELRRIDVLVSRLRAKAQSAGLKLPVVCARTGLRVRGLSAASAGRVRRPRQAAGGDTGRVMTKRLPAPTRLVMVSEPPWLSQMRRAR